MQQYGKQKTIQDNFEEYNMNVDLFYNMFFTKTNDIDYLEHTPGISNIEFTIHPLYNINFPLEILFKLIHSTYITHVHVHEGHHDLQGQGWETISFG